MEKNKYYSRSPPSLHIMRMISINKSGNTNSISLCLWNFRRNILHSIRVYLQPTDLYINLSLIFKEDGVTDDPELHVVIEVAKYSKHSKNIYLPWCRILPPHFRNRKLNIKCPKGGNPILTANKNPVPWNLTHHKNTRGFNFLMIPLLKWWSIDIEHGLKDILNLITHILGLGKGCRGMCWFIINVSSYHVNNNI